MELGSISSIAAQGLDFERARIERSSTMIALSNVAFASEDAAVQFMEKLVQQNSHTTMLQNSGELDISVKQVVDPDNPLSDPNGIVFYVDVNPTREMANLVSASRAYEANIKAYNTNSRMVGNALRIGGER